MQRRKLKPDFAPPHKLGTVDNLSMVSSLCWGPKGTAKETPDKVCMLVPRTVVTIRCAYFELLYGQYLA